MFILLITNEIDKKTIIKNDIKTIPNDFKFDLRLRTCRVEIINPTKIQNCETRAGSFADKSEMIQKVQR